MNARWIFTTGDPKVRTKASNGRLDDRSEISAVLAAMVARMDGVRPNKTEALAISDRVLPYVCSRTQSRTPEHTGLWNDCAARYC